MDRFKAMIEARFAQRNMKHDALKRWDEYRDTTYGRILDRKASLIVYYDHLQPIAIGLNIQREQALFSAITTYDIQYHKYSLGLQLIMAKIQWSYELGIKFVDLGWGDLEHKKALANRLEAYRTDVVYPAGKPWLKPLAYVIVKALSFKFSLRELKVKSRLLNDVSDRDEIISRFLVEMQVMPYTECLIGYRLFFPLIPSKAEDRRLSVPDIEYLY